VRIVIEREVQKYKSFVYDFYWRGIRPMYKYRELTEEQAKIAEEIRESWFRLKDEWNIKDDDE
jgi:hypothetical protein